MRSSSFSSQVSARDKVEALSFFGAWNEGIFGIVLGFVITGERKQNLAQKEQAHEDIIKGHLGHV
ncbi:hypothetical protein OROGR_001648 [Orobanche gracilis]